MSGEKQAFPKFDFKLLEGYTPYDGDGWPDLITNGVYAVKIASAQRAAKARPSSDDPACT